MTVKSCPRIDKCRLIEGQLEISKKVREEYKQKYCFSGFNSCKRLMIIEKLHICPDFVLPDSTFSIDEVLDKMENEPNIKN